MKKSRILKIICYVSMPIILATLIMSIMHIAYEDSVYYNEEKYYKSEQFAISYMETIARASKDLIYNNSSYRCVIDNNVEIYYSNTNSVYMYNIKASDPIFLIIYKNKAYTNVNLTTETNSIEKLKLYIKKNNNIVNIINGQVESNVDVIQQESIKYFEGINTYFTITSEDTEEYYGTPYREYVTTSTEDFEIYSSYVERFENNEDAIIMEKIFDELPLISEYGYIIIPIDSILILLIIIYLIISIGYKKDVEGIALNDFDKIPLEIILFMAVMIGCIPFMVLEGIDKNYDAIVCLINTACITIYLLFAITIHTIVKRIKSKTLLKTTISGRILIFAIKCLKKCIKGIKDGLETMFYSANMTLRVLMYVAAFAIISMFNFLIFRDNALVILIEFGLIIVAIYKVIKALKNYSQIENKLKEMYEGNNQNELEINEFVPELQNTVKYINDISNGFENAIQDRIKSERMKAELITNVSHDIKTPLTSIINYVDLLKQENIENEKVNEYIEILVNKSQRLKRLTEDLVEASKVSTGNISLNLEKINIIELINQAGGEFEDKFKNRGLETIICSQESEININADSRYMYRIIENLFSNISKYALENSRIYIDINQVDKQVVIDIKNISKERLNISAEELMQRFVRGDKSRTTEGSGLGISIAQNLTELQNGEFKLILDGDLFKVELKFDVI